MPRKAKRSAAASSRQAVEKKASDGLLKAIEAGAPIKVEGNYGQDDKIVDPDKVSISPKLEPDAEAIEKLKSAGVTVPKPAAKKPKRSDGSTGKSKDSAPDPVLKKWDAETVREWVLLFNLRLDGTPYQVTPGELSQLEKVLPPLLEKYFDGFLENSVEISAAVVLVPMALKRFHVYNESRKLRRKVADPPAPPPKQKEKAPDPPGRSDSDIDFEQLLKRAKENEQKSKSTK